MAQPKDEASALAKQARQLFGAGHFEEALAMSIRAAELGRAKSQNVVAWAYFQGHVVKRDIEKAFYWASLAVESGDPDAQLLLARIYLCQKQEDKYFEWIRESASQGYPPALVSLALYYERHRGIDNDRDRALELLEKASAKGNLKARIEFARRLIAGRRGFWNRCRGVILFLQTILAAIRVGWRDIGDEQLKW